MNLRSIKWARNIGSSIACGIMPILIAPARWYLGVAIAFGWFIFGCLLDLVIAKFLPNRRP